MTAPPHLVRAIDPVVAFGLVSSAVALLVYAPLTWAAGRRAAALRAALAPV